MLEAKVRYLHRKSVGAERDSEAGSFESWADYSNLDMPSRRFEHLAMTKKAQDEHLLRRPHGWWEKGRKVR